MELVDLTKILKPGDVVYSILHGKFTKFIASTKDQKFPIKCDCGYFSQFGQWYSNYEDGECVIFPSKDQRDWSKYLKEKESEALLEEAKRRYPIGTRFRPAHLTKGNGYFTVETDNFVQNGSGSIRSLTVNGEIFDGRNNGYNRTIYFQGEWAEIIEPLFTTEDGVDIYDGDKYWYVGYQSGSIFWDTANAKRHGNVHTYFSTEKAALEWILKGKPKSSVFSSEQVEEIIRLIKENK